MAFALALLSSVLWGASDFGGGLLSKRLRPLAVVGWAEAIGLVCIAITSAIFGTGTHLSHHWILWSIIAGISGPLALACFYSALAMGTMGVVSPIASLGAAVPVVAGLTLGERPHTLQLLGIVLGLAGAVVASGPEFSGRVGALSIVFAVASGFLFGVMLLAIERGSNVSVLMTLLGMRCTSVTVFAIIAVVFRSTGQLRHRDFLPVAAVGVGDFAANLAYAQATALGLLPIVAALSSLYPVITILCARIILGERMARLQKIGVGFALAGVALITLP